MFVMSARKDVLAMDQSTVAEGDLFAISRFQLDGNSL
jgi:hypothetical protein